VRHDGFSGNQAISLSAILPQPHVSLKFFIKPTLVRGGGGGEKLAIFHAWSDEPWVNEGAAVRVSLVGFGQKMEGVMFDGQPVTAIHADLTAQTTDANPFDLTQAQPLSENAGVSFIGTQKNGPFDISSDLARQWLLFPNPHGRSNSDVLRPWANGMDLTRRYSSTWIIDFGTDMQEKQAALYEAPFEYVLRHVKPMRENLRRDGHRKYWWRHGETRPGLRRAIAQFDRFIATSMVSKHRFFVWLPKIQIPENLVVSNSRPLLAS
jgi:type II restriction/modification system DNA methylase subunit YeeA